MEVKVEWRRSAAGYRNLRLEAAATTAEPSAAVALPHGMGYNARMSATEPTYVETGEPPPAELVEVGVYPNARDGFEHGLVVLALGWPYWLMPVAQGFSLLVEPTAGESVREQLARYDRDRNPQAPAGERRGAGIGVYFFETDSARSAGAARAKSSARGRAPASRAKRKPRS